MPFARETDGRISQRGAHTFRRTAFAGDYTGLEIQRTLVNRARQLAVPIIDTMYVTRILTRDGMAFGAYGFDIGDGTRYVVHADAVILAAGGHTRIWRRLSQGPPALFPFIADASCDLPDQGIYYIGHRLLIYERSEPADAVRSIRTIMHHP